MTSLQAQVLPMVENMELGGVMGQRFEANNEQWMLTAPYANPGMLEMYARRNQDHQIMVKWYGEFTGKYLTSATLTYTMTHDERLRTAIDYVVSELAKVQDTDGYLGVWPDHMKLTGWAPGGLGKTWDAWSHYHNMIGLYYCYKLMGNEQDLDVLKKAADCLYQHYYVRKNTIEEDKDGTDAAIGHIFALLYEMDGNEKYRQMVDLTFETFTTQQGGDYYRAGLQGVPFYQMRRHRWECLHAVEMIYEMARLTGEGDYKKSFINIWNSVKEGDRHNTGGFSSGESACGNPYDTRAIETCCTIAWMALTMDMLDMTQDSRVADELELSTWNAFIGAQHPSGRMFTYNTPMLGDKKASAHNIVFQAIAGSSELNCCSVNAPRGFGMIGQWGMYVKEKNLTINYYGESSTTLRTPEGKAITIEQSGAYPFGSDIALKIKAKGVEKIRLRIPEWSKATTVTRNGKSVEGVVSGCYLELS
ncbi:MAG: glycoside hydrolase family 127 protein, partial [Rikenellaceae bacterium]|nr:glycoside hydrolase family 127 protein [Rikenellaceae bacterium]